MLPFPLFFLNFVVYAKTTPAHIYLSARWAICGMPKYFLKCSRTLRTPCRRFATSLYCLFLVNILERWSLKFTRACQHIVVALLRYTRWVRTSIIKIRSIYGTSSHYRPNLHKHIYKANGELNRA